MFNLTRMLLLAAIWSVPVIAWCAEPKLENSVDDLVVEAELPHNGRLMGFGFGALWMMSGPKLLRVDGSDNHVVEIDLGNKYGGPSRVIGTGEGAVWVADVGGDTIFKIDPVTNRLVGEIPAKMASAEGTIGVGEGAIWVITEEAGERTLVRFDAANGGELAKITLPSSAVAVVVAYGSVWVTGDTKSQLYRIDPKTNAIAASIPMSSQPRYLASGEEAIWVFNQGDGVVERVDPATNQVVARIVTGRPGGGGNMAVGGGYVWLSMLHGTPVVQIDAKANKLLRNFRGYGVDSGWGDAIQFGAGSVWVSGSSVHRIAIPK